MLEDLQLRLTELEIRLTHQQLLVDELNEIVIDCNLRIDRLSKDNERLREMLGSLSPQMEESPDE